MKSLDALRKLLPGDAARWLANVSGDAARAWRECPRAEWLLRMATLVEVDRQTLVHTTAELVGAALASRRLPDLRPNRALVTARRWLRSEAGSSEAWAAGFIAMDAAASFDDPSDVVAARAAAGLAFACDDLADGIFYAHRAYAALAAGEAARALGSERDAAHRIRAAVPIAIFLDAVAKAQPDRPRPPGYTEPASDSFYC